MSAPRTQKLYGRISTNRFPTLPENETRMDLVPAGRVEDDWYIEFPELEESGSTDVAEPGPTDWVTFDPEMEITVVRRVKAKEFMAFLEISQRWARSTSAQPAPTTANGSQSKSSQVAVDFGMGGSGGSGGTNPTGTGSGDSGSSDTGTDSEGSGEDDFGDSIDYPSCPSTLGFRC